LDQNEGWGEKRNKQEKTVTETELR